MNEISLLCQCVLSRIHTELAWWLGTFTMTSSLPSSGDDVSLASVQPCWHTLCATWLDTHRGLLFFTAFMYRHLTRYMASPPQGASGYLKRRQWFGIDTMYNLYPAIAVGLCPGSHRGLFNIHLMLPGGRLIIKMWSCLYRDSMVKTRRYL